MLLLCLFSPFVFSQTAPTSLFSPPQPDQYRIRLIDQATGNPIPLVELHSTVRVIGDRAETTLDMTFSHASGGQPVEGQIDLRLPEGAIITRFAFQVGGVLREAVPKVNSALGSMAEDMNPASPREILAPKTESRAMAMAGQQQFRAKVFPIMAGEEKRVVIAWEEKMKYLDGDDFYRCPLHFPDEVRLFSFEAIAENQPFVPVMKNHPLGPVAFKRKGNAYRGRVEARSYVPDTPIEVLFPVNPPEAQLFFEPQADSTWFYLRTFMGSPWQSDSHRPHRLPKRILLLWDVSFSGLLRDHAKELDLLDQYLPLLNNVNIEVVTFADRIVERASFEIKNHQWDSLREFLENQAYDGATLPGNVSITDPKYDEIFLFTDGSSSYGPPTMQIPSAPVYAVASSPLTRSHTLANLCTSSGGKFLNLSTLTVSEALSAITTDQFRFISAKFPRGKIRHLSPATPTDCPDGFTISGVFRGRGTKIELRFGYGDRVTQKLKYELRRPESHKVTKGLARIWASKKLDALMLNAEENETEITALGTGHQLITPYTSLMVLERVEDYVKYEIEPPADLKREFDRQMLIRREAMIRAELDSNAARVERLEEVLYDYMDRIDWYELGQEKAAENSGWLPEERERFKKAVDSLGGGSKRKEEKEANGNAEPVNAGVTLEGVLRGQVVDPSGSPLPGAVVRIIGTDLGSYTDQEGRFFIRLDSAAQDSLSPETTLLVKAYRHQDLEIRLAEIQDRPILRMEAAKLAGPDESVEKESPFPGIEAVIPKSSQVHWTQPDSNFMALPDGMVYVLDGVVQDTFPMVRHRDVSEVEAVQSDRILFRYGLPGLRGMQFIFRDPPMPDERDQAITTALQLPPWDSTRPYLDSLRRVPSPERYACYLRLRDEYGASPSYYAEVADFFIGIGRESEGLRILGNLAEFDLGSPEPLRTLAYQLQIMGRDREALPVLQRVWDQFPDEPQSWRDLALAHARSGQYQRAVDLLNDLLQKDWTAVADLYQGIEQTALAELNALLATRGSSLRTDHIDQRAVYRMPIPLRITVDWNRFETDVDLYLVTPAGDTLDLTDETEISFPGTDMVDGYGPEEILLREAKPGPYQLLVDYYDDAKHNEMGPTLLKITVMQGFGAENEQSRVYGVRLVGEVERREVLRFRFR